MISATVTEPQTVTRQGSVAAALQATWRLSASAAGERLFITLRGPAETVSDLSTDADYRPGATSLPAAVTGLAVTGDIICESAELQVEPGAMASLTLVYRERNARERTTDCEAGLLSRVISSRWVERQEMLEHFMARKSSDFDATAFAAWLNEPDAAVKASHSYTNESGTVVALENDTLAAAERFDMGVQYAALFMLQIEVSELWNGPVNTSAACNSVISAIPAEHRPLFSVDGLEGHFSFMRVCDSVQHRGENLHARTVVYLCLPDDLAPATPPTGWGTGPIDELLYGSAGGGQS